MSHPREFEQARPRSGSTLQLDRQLYDRLAGFAGGCGASPLQVVLASAYCYFSRTNGRNDFRFGLVMSPPEHPAGPAGNLATFHLRFGTNLNFIDLVSRIKSELPADFLAEPDRGGSRQETQAKDHYPKFDLILYYQAKNCCAGAQGVQAGAKAEWTPSSCGAHGHDTRLPGMAVSECAAGSHMELEFEQAAEAPGRPLYGLIEKHLGFVLGEALRRPYEPIGRLDLMSEAERRAILLEFNETACDHPTQTIVELIERQVEETPDEIAVVFGREQLTFREVNERANRVADCLRREHRLQPEERVGLLLSRTEWMVVGILAVLKAGAAYLPIDPEYPAERIRHMLADSACRVVLTEESLIRTPAIANAKARALDIRSLRGESRNPPPTATPANAAYVIYTSGSTGLPKGVLIEHRSVSNLFHSLQQILYRRFGGKIREVLSAPFFFDASAQQTLSSLANGNTLHVVDDSVRRDPRLLIQYLSEQRIQLCNVVAPFLAAMLEEGLGENLPESLLHIVTGGESVSPALVDKFYRHPKCEGIIITNMYGPTENCVDSTCFHIDSGFTPGAPTVPIGRPLPNSQVYILDTALRPVPAGVPGEICVAGAGLARGYVNNHALTAEKFVPHPFGEGERMYRTGDLGRWRPDGNVEFLGRLDEQVKIRGYRIEPGEIENALLKFPAVKEASVAAEAFGGSDKVLTAFVAGGDDLKVDELREHLRGVLPDYMVPAVFVKLGHLPHTPNGKVDKQALSAIRAQSEPADVYLAPRDEVERLLVDIWREVLGRERVGIRHNFFEMGGHSLKAIQIAGRIHQQLRVAVPLRDLFGNPTVEALARCVRDAKRADFLPIPLTEKGEHYDLAHAQERIWLLHQMEGGDVAYNIPIALAEEGIDLAALRRAFVALLRRHEILRTAFVEVGGAPKQKVYDEVRFEIAEDDLREDGDARQQALEIATREAHTPFDLTEPPLLRVRVIRLTDDECLLLLTIHHIICDGWSINVLFREINALYDAARQGHDAQLRPPSHQYRDYAAWHNAKDLAREERYWLGKLKGVPERLNLPYDFPPRSDGNFRGRVEAGELDAHITAGLRRLAARRGATVSSVLLTVYLLFMFRLTKQADICVGVGTANRTHPDLEGLIGFFVNVLPIRVSLAEDMELGEVLDQVTRNAYEAFEHQDYPVDMLIRKLNPNRQANRQPLFNVMYAFQNFSDLWIDVGRRKPRPAQGEQGMNVLDKSRFFDLTLNTSKFDLTLFAHELEQTILLSFEYDSELFRPETVCRYLSYLERLSRMVGEYAE